MHGLKNFCSHTRSDLVNSRHVERKAGEQAVLRATENISAQVMEEPSIFNSPIFCAVTVLDTEFQVTKSSMLFLSYLVVSVWKSKSLNDLLGQWNRHASLKHTSVVWNQESGAWAVRDAANIFLAAPQLNCMYCRFYVVVLSLSSHFWLFPSNYFMNEVDSWVGSAELKGGSCGNARFGILWNLQEGSRTM